MPNPEFIMGTVGFGLGTGGGTGGEEPFDPATLSPMVWFAADEITGLVDNDPVSTWVNQGAGGNATASLTARPTYKTNIVNGLPVVRFNGTANTMTVADSAAIEASNVTIFAVVRAAAAPANSAYIFNKHFASPTNTSYALQRGAATTLACRMLVRSTAQNITGTSTATQITDAALWDGSAHQVYGVTTSGGLARFAALGLDVGNAALASNLTYDAGNLYLGSFDGASLFAAYDLCELFVVGSTLSSINIGLMSTYLKDKWALTA